MTAPLRLVVVPSDPIADYERAGYDRLARYYNPGGLFDEVFVVSPREHGERRAHGMTVLGVAEHGFVAALARLRPDVVRAYGGGWTADLACRHRLPGVPVVASVHTVHPAALRRSLRYADLVICMSRVVAERVRGAGTAANRIRILPNRIDTAVFRPVADGAARAALDGRFPAGRRVLHVGRRSEQKNLDTVIRALASLSAEYAGVFVGLGDAREYAALAASLGVGHRCFWVDAVPNAELPAWYSWCDCLCVPSRWEGFGIVFIEAAACGAPVVTSNIAPMNEYLVADESACLVDRYEDPDAVAAAIARVCEDADYRARLSAGARTAARPFDAATVDAAEVAIYREALALRGRCHGPLSPAQRLDLDARAAAESAFGALRAVVPRPVKRLARRALGTRVP